MKLKISKVVVVGLMFGSAALAMALNGSPTQVLISALVVPGLISTGNMLMNAGRKLRGEQPIQLVVSENNVEISMLEEFLSASAGLAGGYAFKGPVGAIEGLVAGPGLLVACKTLAQPNTPNVAPRCRY